MSAFVFAISYINEKYFALLIFSPKFALIHKIRTILYE